MAILNEKLQFQQTLRSFFSPSEHHKWAIEQNSEAIDMLRKFVRSPSRKLRNFVKEVQNEPPKSCKSAFKTYHQIGILEGTFGIFKAENGQ